MAGCNNSGILIACPESGYFIEHSIWQLILVWPAEGYIRAGNRFAWPRMYFIFRNALNLGIPIRGLNGWLSWHPFYRDIIAVDRRQVPMLILKLNAYIETCPVDPNLNRIGFGCGERFPFRRGHIRFWGARPRRFHPHFAHLSKGAGC